MPHEPRHVTFLEREGRLEHYGIGSPSAEQIGAVRRARNVLKGGDTEADLGRALEAVDV